MSNTEIKSGKNLEQNKSKEFKPSNLYNQFSSLKKPVSQSVKFKKIIDKNIIGLCKTQLYFDSSNTYFALVTPGVYFPETKDFLNLNKLNKLIKLSNRFIDKLNNTKVLNIENFYNTSIMYTNELIQDFNSAKYTVIRNDYQFELYTLFLTLNKSLIIIAMKNHEPDFSLIKGIIRTYCK
ncbi:MAG: hypothetical protein AB1782_02995 [Cyanobacteriota bacterium]